MPDLVPKNLAAVSNTASSPPMCGGSSSSYALHGARISSTQIDSYRRRYQRASPSLPAHSFDSIVKRLADAGESRDMWCAACDLKAVAD